MWPYVLTLAIGDICVVVATDDDTLAGSLAPWVTAAAADIDSSVVDFTAELHPPPPAHRSVPRQIPVVHHGSSVLARSTDLIELRTAVLRVLGSIATEVPEGCVRLTGVPLLRGGGIALALPQTACDGSRTLRRRGFDPLYAGWVVVNPDTLTLHIAAPLGSTASPTIAPLQEWWSDLPPAIPPWSFGQCVAMTVSRTTLTPHVDGGTSSHLAALVALMERHPPRLPSDPLE